METNTQNMTRNDVTKAIKDALKRRSGINWSVTGGRGTAYGWLTIDAPNSLKTWHFVPNRETNDREEYNDPSKPYGHMGPETRAKLAELLGLEDIHFQGHSIPARGGYWEEYLDRANGRTPTRCGEVYWD